LLGTWQRAQWAWQPYMNDRHQLQLSESVLHDRLCNLQGVKLPYILAMSQGRVNMATDLCSYNTRSAAQARVSQAKVNFKKLMRVYAAKWRAKGQKVELSIGLNTQLGRQRFMVASSPAHHAEVVEYLFQTGTCSHVDTNCLWSEAFDPYIVLGLSAWLFKPADNQP
jgi:hypothetical protein